MVIADKYRYYQIEVRKKKISQDINHDKVIYLSKENMEKTPEGQVLDEMGIKNVCCRRHLLCHVDIE
jgi:DNA-directed RNA polymerase I, II, and III subunit RPABC5